MACESYFAQLLQVMFPKWTKDRWLVVLQAFVDDSTQEKDGVLALAGYLWNEQEARHFDTAWRPRIKAWGLSRWHMTDWESGYEEFVGWPDSKKDKRLQALHQIINRTMTVGVWLALDRRAYQTLTKAQQRPIGNEYMLCARLFIAVVSKYLKELQIKTTVAYVLDKRQSMGPIRQAFDRLKQDDHFSVEHHLGSLTTDSSLDVTHLQAADILAWEMAKEQAHALGRHDRPFRKTLSNLLATTDKDTIGMLVDQKKLMEFVEIGLKTQAETSGAAS